MSTILGYLDERAEEFKRHYSIAKMLEGRISSDLGGEEFFIEVRHINTLKSGLIVHLYNIVESVMDRIMAEVTETIVKEAPKCWRKDVFHEWMRGEFYNMNDQSSESLIDKFSDIGFSLVAGSDVQKFVFKGVSGTWTIKKIKAVATRFGCLLDIPADISKNAHEKIYRDNKDALTYLARRRGAISHGSTTFEEGVQDMTLDGLEALADRVLPYIRAVVESYLTYLDEKKYLSEAEAIA